MNVTQEELGFIRAEFPIYYSALGYCTFLFALNGFYILLVLFRMKQYPIKAYSPALQLLKLLSLALVVAYLGSVPLIPPIAFTFLSVLLPLAWMLPTAVLAWRIYFLHKLSTLKIEYNALVMTNSTAQQMAQKQHQIKIARGLLSYWFGLLVVTISWATHFLYYIVFAILLSVFPSPTFLLIGAFGLGLGANAVEMLVFGVIIGALVICIIRIKVKENFGILKSLGVNIVCTILIVIDVILEVVIRASRQGHYEEIHGVYRTVSNVIVATLCTTDTTLTILVPTIKTFFWKAKTSDVEAGTQLALLKSVLNDAAIYESFKKFALKEFSVENIMFHENFVEYQKSKSRTVAQVILNEFVTKNGNLALNITEDQIEQCHKAFKSGTESEFDDKLQVVCDAVYVVLIDTLSRFKKDEAFKAHTQARQKLGWGG